MKKLTVYLLLLSSPIAFSATIRMVQSDKTFLGSITDKEAAEAFDNPAIEEKNKVETLNLKQGDTIIFANRDEVKHNVSGWNGTVNIFDVKIQEPGPNNDRSIILDKKGNFVIQCAIHPKMKIKLKVD